VFVEPTISAASNGLTIETGLEGSFNVAGKTASGSGSFAIMNGATRASSHHQLSVGPEWSRARRLDQR